MFCPNCHKQMEPAKSGKGTVCHKCKVAVTTTWVRIGLVLSNPLDRKKAWEDISNINFASVFMKDGDRKKAWEDIHNMDFAKIERRVFSLMMNPKGNSRMFSDIYKETEPKNDEPREDN